MNDFHEYFDEDYREEEAKGMAETIDRVWRIVEFIGYFILGAGIVALLIRGCVYLQGA